ncbi:MAG: hypothetical protein GY727_06250 [Gammaproteobacteria bacterium]|nr:hypothetical protein [Gammaproteobacteria bacterium]
MAGFFTSNVSKPHTAAVQRQLDKRPLFSGTGHQECKLIVWIVPIPAIHDLGVFVVFVTKAVFNESLILLV